jgi:hypothetical protein
VKGNIIQDLIIQNSFSPVTERKMTKTHSFHSNLNRLDYFKPLIRSPPLRNNKRSSTSLFRRSLGNEQDYSNSHLNYMIEIDHPYLQKCVIKGDYIFDALEFYKQLKRFIK